MKYRINRDRKKRLLKEERALAENLCGVNQFGWRQLDDRNCLDFDFESFMTYHINGMNCTEKMWCDGAVVEKCTKNGPNRFNLSGKLWLLPEDETPKKYSSIEVWDSFDFVGYVLLNSKSSTIKDYKFLVSGHDIKVQCHRKI